MSTYLHRFTVKPGHLDDYLSHWEEEVSVRRRHGFWWHRAFVETDAEPKLTWLYAHADGDSAFDELAADPAFHQLQQTTSPHRFGNLVIRPVDVEVLPGFAHKPRTVIMRRYSIAGSWEGFLDVWRRIVPVRERHGFPCLFAVADRPHDMFTWAFGFDGAWEEFPDAQRDYYRDPARVELRGVFDYMADYAIHPARVMDIPDTLQSNNGEHPPA